ncbi:MAG: [FeFe] hydrogenase H-cluster radical SAM maturase HydE [Thermoanaerobacteraceae bacterium]|nr:[FeFe] hydrogenase H-cluster radical SAM maturase HydE [Thermoanaerobacteraceae bacterium]
MTTKIEKVITKALKTHELNKEEIIMLLEAEGKDKELLFQEADKLRKNNFGDEVHLRGIIEFSNYCSRECFYCGLRCQNHVVNRNRMTIDEIYEAAKEARNQGYMTIVLQSGEDSWYKVDILAELIKKMKDNLDLAITMSVGENSKNFYKILREAGADRYLLKHETSDKELFEKLRPGTTLQGRLNRLKDLRELGYQIGGGFMVGLPGQSIETLADDILLTKELDVEMAGIGPFIPHPETPLRGYPVGSVSMVLKAIAITRLLLPLTHLPATTALANLSPEGRFKALSCGANVIMPDLTPMIYKTNYEIYPKSSELLNFDNSFASWEKELLQHGRRVSKDYGHTPKPGFFAKL